jgi:prepilin-type N-terminal cleavage/methylation domain-containing protein
MSKVSKQRGFTIIELMISTAVFSAILLVILTAITQIGRMYYKGVTISKTQEAARSIVDSVSQEIQFSPSSYAPTYAVSGERNIRCVGNSRFFYVVNQKKTDTNYGLWADDSGAGSPLCVDSASLVALGSAAIPTSSPSSTNPRELLPQNMRIAKFEINGSGSLYTVSVRVLYGDDDLMEAVDPATGSILTPASDYPQFLTCKGSTVGTQFCGVSELTVTVNKRL